jgi:hypothetical protein
MDDDAPAAGRARRDPSESSPLSDPLSDPVSGALHRYAQTHEPDTDRIKARIGEGLRDDARAAGSAGTGVAVHPSSSTARRLPVPLLVAAAVAILVLGIPLGATLFTPGPTTPAGPGPVTSGPQVTMPSATPSRTHAAAAPTKRSTPTKKAVPPSAPTKTKRTTPAAEVEQVAWPAAQGRQSLSATKTVTGTFDGKLRRYSGTGALGGDPEQEDLGPLFELEDGAVLRNVIIGARSADGVHCRGSCTLENVWWEDVGDDAATLRGTESGDVMQVVGGGARHAGNSVFTQNGPGRTEIRNFLVDDFGKLYRSCGNCRDRSDRHVVIDGVTATAPGDAIVGINTNQGDTASISHLVIRGDSERSVDVCQWYKGVPSGGTSSKVGEGSSDSCDYEQSDVTYER